MNRFQEHHQSSIAFSYSCFDRMILNGFIPAFQHSKRAGTIHWFLHRQRQIEKVNRKSLARLSCDYHDWVSAYAAAQGIDIVEPKKVRREDWVEPYFQNLGGRPGIAVILKAREPERIAVHFPSCNQLGVEFRNVNLYYFYLDDVQCGRMFVRMRTPVLTASFKSTSLKQYVSNGQGLRVESGSYQLKELSVPKNVNNLPKLRKVLHTANQRCLDVQQDILATYVDRGQLQELRRPSTSANGRRVPGMRVDDPRLIAVLHAITCFAYLVGKGCFRTRDLLPDVQRALGNPQYRLSQLRYDLGKLRSKGFIQRVPKTQSYQATEQGYAIAILYMKIYQRLYAPLAAAFLESVPGDNQVLSTRQTKLDRLYVAVHRALTDLGEHLGIVNITDEAA